MVFLADVIAVVHGLAVVLMLVGSLLALRWPRVLWLHIPVALTILAINLAGASCFLTDWELALLERAGEPGYEGGFLGHYFFSPLGLDVDATSSQVGMYVVAVGLNALGYGLLAHRYWHARRAEPGRGHSRSGNSTLGARG